MVRNRSEKFRDIVLVTTQNFHRHTLSAPPRLFASECAPPDRECPSSQKIFPTQSLYAPATSTQPQRRNTDVRGRSYHVPKLSTPRLEPDSAGFGDTPRFGGVGREWATHFVCNLSRRISDFPFFSSKEHPSRGRNGRPSQAGRARRTSLSEGGVASLRVSVTYVREDHPRPARRGPLAQRQGRSASTARSRVRVRQGSGCGGGGESGSAAVECSQCVWTEAMWRGRSVTDSGQHGDRAVEHGEDEQRHRSGNISLSHYIPRRIS